MSVVREDEALPAPQAPAPPVTVAPSSESPLVHSAPPRLHRILATRFPQQLARRVQRTGKSGLTGMALLVFAGAFFLGANVSLKDAANELQTTLDSARATRDTHVNPQQVRATAVRGLMNTLPDRAALPAITGKIVAQAEAAGIALDRGNYDLTLTHSGKLVRARMTFPVHGRYPDIRHFIDATLVAVPGAAVDGLRLERRDIGAAEIDADIRFAVYVRGTP